MNTVAGGKPLPLPDEASRPFWEGARRHRLVFPFCTTCQRWLHPSSEICREGHRTIEHRELSGRGTVYSFTTVREPTTRGLEPPYVVAIVQLEEQNDVCLITNLVELDGVEPAIGTPVEVTFEDVAEDCSLPQFRPARGA